MSPFYHEGCNREVSSYMKGDMAPYYYENVDKGVSSYNYDGGRQGISPYNNYECGNQGVVPYSYGGGNEKVSPYYYKGENEGATPYKSAIYFQQGISPYNYQNIRQPVQPYRYEGVSGGVSPYSYGSQAVSPYQGMGMIPKPCPPKEQPPIITKVECKRKCCKKTEKPGDFGITPMSAKDLSGLGPLAKKYLNENTDFVFGLHYDKELKGYRVGYHLARVEGDDIVVDYEDEVMKYKGTEGLWRLITQDTSYFDDEFYFDDEDWVVYMEILLRTNYHKCIDTVAENSKDKKVNVYKVEDEGVEVAPMFLCCLGLGAAGGFAVGGTAGLTAGVAVGGTIGFIGGVGFTISTLLGLKLAAPLAITFGKVLHHCLAKKAEIVGKGIGTVAKGGVKLYGKIGQMNKKLYDALKGKFTGAIDKIPGKPGWLGKPSKNYLKFWKWFQCPTCVHCRELDELLRLLIGLQKPESSRNKLCGFNQNCLLFWILERIVACFGNDGGCERLIDWLKVNMSLIKMSKLLKQFIENLPWGYHCEQNPICAPPTKEVEKDKKCKDQSKKYKWLLELDVSLKFQVKLGMEVLEELFRRDPKFFEKLEGSLKLSCKELSEALKKALQFLKSYFGGCKI